jgi:hypothetical protein
MLLTSGEDTIGAITVKKLEEWNAKDVI